MTAQPIASGRGRAESKVLMTTDFRRQPTYPSAASFGVMNEIPTTEVTAGRLTSTPVVAVTVDHSLAAAWEAMRQRRDLVAAVAAGAAVEPISPAEWHDVDHG